MFDRIVDVANHLGHWGYVIIFVVVVLECQALLGLFMPGETAVLAGGFLAGHGVYQPLALIVIVSAAAIIGDGIGYEMGRRLGRGWLVQHGRWFGVRERQLNMVDTYFHRHGGKSVFASHFLHVLRALMPFMAGASHMRYSRFFSYNAAGCVVWASVFTLLGYFFGESWQFIEHWIGRASKIVGVLLLATIALVWIGRWIVRNEAEIKRAWLAFLERPAVIALSTHWAANRRRLQNLLTPQGYLATQLTLGAACLVTSCYFLGGMLKRLVVRGPLTPLDEQLAEWFHEHATLRFTELMTQVSFFGSIRWITAVVTVVALFLLVRQLWYRLLMLAAVLPGGGLIGMLLKVAFRRERPDWNEAAQALNTYSFPSGHAMGATLLYGFLAVLAVRATSSWTLRVLSIMAALLLVLLVDFSRVYLVFHYLTDVIGGTIAALIWLAVCITGVNTLRRRTRGAAVAQTDSPSR
jgi:undecaprenyl-diphosphatase